MSNTRHKLVMAVFIAILMGLTTIGLKNGWAGSPNRPGSVQSASLKSSDLTYPWLKTKAGERLDRRIKPPKGFRRIAVPQGSFADWLRRLPLKPGNPQVLLHNGKPKTNQNSHHAIVLIDVGKKNLQQCADAIIRLRAEYLRSIGCENRIAFRFTSGDLAEWKKWQAGYRPRVKGNKVSWSKTTRSDGRYSNFRRYLNSVFMYAGTVSLSKELKPVKNPAKVEIGDVFIRGGFPGHALLVVDVAENAAGKRVFLLAQSFMPAQEVHILRNPHDRIGPWYHAAKRGNLVTPEWTFQYTDLKRFRCIPCGAKRPSKK